MIRTYSELSEINNFKERFNYLKLNGVIGEETFGHDRYLCQALYLSYDWRQLRREIILRDNGNDLACEGFEIFGKIMIHHLNPISSRDIKNRSSKIFNPENLISTILKTHNAIHYGDANLLSQDPIERKRNDTCPWR